MINLLVDEAYDFDYLSILFIKAEKNNFSGQTFDNWKKCYDYLKIQINNQNLWDNIICSQEFYDMKEANLKTFEAVDKAKNNEVTAKDVDYCNYLRHIAKEKFQKKFFNSNLSEQKIGYEKYI